MAIGIKAELDQAYAQRVKQQFNVLINDLKKSSDVKIDLNTSQLTEEMKKATKSISETVKIYQQLGEVSANKLHFDDKGKLDNFNVQLERTKGIIENIGYSMQKVGNKNLFVADGVNVSNKQNEYAQKVAEAQVQLSDKEKAKELSDIDIIENKRLEMIAKRELDEKKLAENQAKYSNEAILDNQKMIDSIEAKRSEALAKRDKEEKALLDKNEKEEQSFIDTIENKRLEMIAKREQVEKQSNQSQEQFSSQGIEQENLRVQKLGQSIKSFAGVDLFAKSNQEIKDFVTEVTGAGSKVVSFQKTIDGAGNSVIKMAVNTKNTKNEIEQEKIIIDQNTQSIYKNEESLRANTARNVGFVDRLKNAAVK